LEPVDILISAGEASGDLYAARLVEELRARIPGARFFGCAGPKMRAAGVEAVVESESLAVVGLVEVLQHIPRIYGEFRKLLAAARERKPRFAVLTDSPDFHLRVAKKLKRMGIPVCYLVAPQVWAWRVGRVKAMRRDLDQLFCIFPFEEKFFSDHQVATTYIGHPLARTIAPQLSRAGFFAKHNLPAERPLIALLPGSRVGEAGRHLPHLFDAADLLQQRRPLSFVWAAPGGFLAKADAAGLTFRERISRSSIQVIEGETWDALAHADMVMAASGTVTMEAALLGTPMVTFYRVTALSWWLGRFLVKVPFYSMVNLIAGKKLVPELMQNECTGPKLAEAAWPLLADPAAAKPIRDEFRLIREQLTGARDPIEIAADFLANRYHKNS
jgi:lipid-A-disaccharide synthase